MLKPEYCDLQRVRSVCEEFAVRVLADQADKHKVESRKQKPGD